MSKAFLGAFAVIAVGAVGVVDYTNQAHKAEVPVGSLSAADYLMTLTTRLGGNQPAESPAVAVRALPKSEPSAQKAPAAPISEGASCTMVGKVKHCSLSGG